MILKQNNHDKVFAQGSIYGGLHTTACVNRESRREVVLTALWLHCRFSLLRLPMVCHAGPLKQSKARVAALTVRFELQAPAVCIEAMTAWRDHTMCILPCTW